jgi:hypothetical protein
MPKFRSRKIVEATRWFKQGDHPAVEPIPDKYKNFIPVQDGATGFIPSTGHSRFVFPGDWIVDDEGEFYALHPQAFESEYEPVGQPAVVRDFRTGEL